MVAPNNLDKPNNFEQAMKSPNKEKWMSIIEDEMEYMKSNHVWDLVDLLPNHRAIGNKWTNKIKS